MPTPTLSIRILLLPPSTLPPLHFHASLHTFHTLNYSPPPFYSVPWRRRPLPPDRDTTDNTLCHSLNLHRLYILVHSLGGFESVKVHEWAQISEEIKDEGKPPLAPEDVVAVYTQYLYEYEIFSTLVRKQFKARQVARGGEEEQDLGKLVDGIERDLWRASDRLVWKGVENEVMQRIPEMMETHLPSQLRDVGQREKLIRREVSGSDFGVYPYTRAEDERREELDVKIVDRTEEIMDWNRECGLKGRYTPSPRPEELGRFVEDEASTIKGSTCGSVSAEESQPGLNDEFLRWGIPNAQQELLEKYGFKDCTGMLVQEDDEVTTLGLSVDYADYVMMVGGPKSKKMMEWWMTRLQFEGGLWEPTAIFADQVKFDDMPEEEEESEEFQPEERKKHRIKKWRHFLGHRWKFNINLPKATHPVSMRMLSHRKGRDKGHESDVSSTNSDSGFELDRSNHAPVARGKDALGRSLLPNLKIGQFTRDVTNAASSHSLQQSGNCENTWSAGEQSGAHQLQRFPTVSHTSRYTYASTSGGTQIFTEPPPRPPTRCEPGNSGIVSPGTASQGGTVSHLGFDRSGGNNGRPPTRGRGPNDKEAKEAADAAWKSGTRYYEHDFDPFKNNPEVSEGAASRLSWSVGDSDIGTPKAVAMAGLQEGGRRLPSGLAPIPKQRLPLPWPMRTSNEDSDSPEPVRRAGPTPSPKSIAKKDADIQELVESYRAPRAPVEQNSVSSYSHSSYVETWADKVQDFMRTPAKSCQWQRAATNGPSEPLFPHLQDGGGHHHPAPSHHLTRKQRKEFEAIHDRLSLERAENNKRERAQWNENVAAHNESQNRMLDLVRHGSNHTRQSSLTRLSPIDSFTIQQAKEVRDRRRRVSDVVRAKAEQKKKEQRELYHRGPETDRRELLARLSPEIQEAERRRAEKRKGRAPPGYGFDGQHDTSSSAPFDSVSTKRTGSGSGHSKMETDKRNTDESPILNHRQSVSHQQLRVTANAQCGLGHRQSSSLTAALSASYGVHGEAAQHNGTSQQKFHAQHQSLQKEHSQTSHYHSTISDRPLSHSRSNTIQTLEFENSNGYAYNNGSQLGQPWTMNPAQLPPSGFGPDHSASNASTTKLPPIIEPINPGLYQAVSCLEPDGRLGHRLIPIPLNALNTDGAGQYLRNQNIHLQQQQTMLQQLQQLQPLLEALQGMNMGQSQKLVQQGLQQQLAQQLIQQQYQQPQIQSTLGNGPGGVQGMDLASALAILGGLGTQQPQRLEQSNQFEQFNQQLGQQTPFAQQDAGYSEQVANIGWLHNGNGISMPQQESAQRSISSDYRHPATMVPLSLRTPASVHNVGGTQSTLSNLNPKANTYRPPTIHTSPPYMHSDHSNPPVSHNSNQLHNWTAAEQETVSRLLNLSYHLRFPLLRSDPSTIDILNNLSTPTPSFTSSELSFLRANWPHIIQLAASYDPTKQSENLSRTGSTAAKKQTIRKFDPEHRLYKLEPKYQNLEPVGEVDKSNMDELYLMSHYISVCKHKRYPVTGQHLVHPRVVEGLGLSEKQLGMLEGKVLRGWCLHPPTGGYGDGKRGVEANIQHN